MRIRVPETGNYRGQLLLQAPFSLGTMIGMVCGVVVAPSLPLAVLVTVGGAAVGLAVGLALANWQAAVSATGYRTVFE